MLNGVGREATIPESLKILMVQVPQPVNVAIFFCLPFWGGVGILVNFPGPSYYFAFTRANVEVLLVGECAYSLSMFRK